MGKRPAPLWQPGVLALFERGPGGWRKKEAVSGLDFRPAAAKLDSLYPVAVDLGSDREQGAAFASFVFAAAAPGGHGGSSVRQLVTWRLDAAAGRLAVTFDDFAGDGRSPTVGAHPPAWPLRLHGIGVTITAPEGLFGHGHGALYLIRGRGPDVAALLGYRAFGSQPSGSLLEVVPVLTGQRPPVEGYELLLTRDAAAQALARADSLQDCLYGVERPRQALTAEAKAPWLQSCEGEDRGALVRLALPSADAGGQAAAQPVYLLDKEGRPLLYTALVAGETLGVAVPAAVDIAVADTPFGRILGDGKALKLAAGEERTLELPARHAGRLKLVAPASSGGPAIVVVTPSSGGDAGILQALGGAPSSVPVPLAKAAGIWLVKRWPAEFEVLAGAYSVSVLRGGDGRVCRHEAFVRAGHRSLLVCDGGSREHSPLKGNAYADLAWRPGPGMTPADGKALAAALGIEVSAHDVEAGTAAAAVGQVATLGAFDRSVGAGLRFFPASPELAARWANVRKEQPADLLGRFALFLKDEDAHGILELGCPGPGADLGEFERLLERLRPDAVQFFGCRTELGETMMALWGRVAATRTLRLTAVSFMDAPEDGLFFPRLALTSTVAAATAEATAGEIGRGTYGLSAGATLLLKELRPLRGAPSGAKGAALAAGKGGVEAVLIMAAAAGVEPRELAVYSEKGLIRRVRVPPAGHPTAVDPAAAPPAASDAAAGGLQVPAPVPGTPLVAPQRPPLTAPSDDKVGFPPTRIRIPLPPLRDVAWIRVELRGIAPSLHPMFHDTAPVGDTLLAVTNFMNVQSLRPQDKETH